MRLSSQPAIAADTIGKTISEKVPAAQSISATAAWLIFCAVCTATGWILSAIQQLNAAGYAVAFGSGAIAVAVWLVRTRTVLFSVPHWPKLLRRFRRLWPMFYLTLASLAFLGGALYRPKNYDGLAYRVPRVLHWLAAGQWHWIHTPFQRVNTHAPGFEWISAPLIVFTRGDRLLFLPNVACFCLMPGLLFICLARLGVRRRVAYAWMWLFPAGYCFLLQAGSIGNDLFVAFLALAAIAYGLRARERFRRSDLWLSILAAGLCTGAKANAIPLMLVWVVIMLFCWRLIRCHLPGTLAVGIVALAVSFFPMAILNWKYCGDWTGGRAEQLPFAGDLKGRLFGNAMIIAINNLSPPVAPFAGRWNDRVAPRLVPAGMRETLANDFQTQGALFGMDEVQIEEGAGLGFGICLLLGVSALAAWRIASPKANETSQELKWLQRAVFAAILVSVLAVMKLTFAKSTPRMLAPYYILMAAPFLLSRGHEVLIRRRWWIGAVVTVWAMAVSLLIINPSRPLFPAQSLVLWLRERGRSGAVLARVEKVYSVYSQRADAFGPAVRALPPDATVLGLVTFDDPESSLWWPFGSRRVIHICARDTPDQLKAKGIRYVLVSPEKLTFVFGCDLETWLKRFNAIVLKAVPMTLRAGGNESNWVIAEIH